jgi:hypothetical protein
VGIKMGEEDLERLLEVEGLDEEFAPKKFSIPF